MQVMSSFKELDSDILPSDFEIKASSGSIIEKILEEYDTKMVKDPINIKPLIQTSKEFTIQ